MEILYRGVPVVRPDGWTQADERAVEFLAGSGFSERTATEAKRLYPNSLDFVGRELLTLADELPYSPADVPHIVNG